MNSAVVEAARTCIEIGAVQHSANHEWCAACRLRGASHRERRRVHAELDRMIARAQGAKK